MLKQFGLHLLFGLLIILGGIFIYMTIATSIGYLTYSDRPGSGWNKDVGISIDALNFILGFIVFLGIYILPTLIVVYLLFLLFKLIGYNRIIFAILGGLIIGALSYYWTLGIGWYIAIDFSTVVVGGLLGVIYGATLFPKYLKSPDK